MHSASAVAILSGPVVLAGYLVGALLATLMHDDEQPAGSSEWLVEAFVTLAVTTAAWMVIKQVSPGSMFSRIGYFSNQVLAAWQSVALWTGVAIIAGICAPVFRGFRGAPGMAAAAALLAVHFPWFLFATLGTAVTAFALARPARGCPVVTPSA